MLGSPFLCRQVGDILAINFIRAEHARIYSMCEALIGFLDGSVANSDTVSKIGLMYCQGQLR